VTAPRLVSVVVAALTLVAVVGGARAVTVDLPVDVRLREGFRVAAPRGSRLGSSKTPPTAPSTASTC